MDALVLCSGFAKRLEPLSEFIPKPLLSVNGKPIIDHILQRITPIGPDRIVIAANRRFQKQFEYWLEGRHVTRKQSIELVIEPTMDNSERLGAIRSIDYALRNAKITENLLIVAGDNYFSFGINPIKELMEATHKASIALYDVKSTEEAKMFGVVNIDKSNRVKGFVEKPEKPRSTLISTGIYAYPKNTLPLFDKYLKGGGNPDGIGHFLEWLILRDTVYGHIYDKGNWFDIGNITTYRKLFYKYL